MIRVIEDYKFQNPFHYDVFEVKPTNYKEIIVPEGFVTNGASIPRFLWSFCYDPFHPKIITGAVIHDYLYSTGIVPRYMADEIAKTIWFDHGAGEKRVALMYKAIRMFGKNFYTSKEDNRTI
jgi:hypothetical protein